MVQLTSVYLSQHNANGMHRPSLQCNLFLHGVSPQLATDSSAPDLQSSLPSQTYRCGRHCPLGQTNIPKLHGGLTEQKIIYNTTLEINNAIIYYTLTAAFDVDLYVGRKFFFWFTMSWSSLAQVISIVCVSQIFNDEFKAIWARGSDDPVLSATPF